MDYAFIRVANMTLVFIGEILYLTQTTAHQRVNDFQVQYPDCLRQEPDGSIERRNSLTFCFDLLCFSEAPIALLMFSIYRTHA